MAKAKVKERVNWPVTILLIVGLITIVFPLYMAVVIAFKDPSEMTNDIAGILSLPSTWSLDNFIEAMRVTDFFRSFMNSLIITVAAVVVSILVHSLAAYAIGRNMDRKKIFKVSYYFIIAGMYVPFAILMMPLVKQTAVMHLDNMVGVMVLYVVFYMPMNMMLYTGYLRNVPVALEEAARVDGASTWTTYWKIIFPLMKPMHATVAVITGLAVERRHDPARHHGRLGREHPAARADELPDRVRHQLQPRVRLVPARHAPHDHLLHRGAEADHRRRHQRCREVALTDSLASCSAPAAPRSCGRALRWAEKPGCEPYG